MDQELVDDAPLDEPDVDEPDPEPDPDPDSDPDPDPVDVEAVDFAPELLEPLDGAPSFDDDSPLEDGPSEDEDAERESVR